MRLYEIWQSMVGWLSRASMGGCRLAGGSCGAQTVAAPAFALGGVEVIAEAMQLHKTDLMSNPKDAVCYVICHAGISTINQAARRR